MPILVEDVPLLDGADPATVEAGECVERFAFIFANPQFPNVYWHQPVVVEIRTTCAVTE